MANKDKEDAKDTTPHAVRGEDPAADIAAAADTTPAVSDEQAEMDKDREKLLADAEPEPAAAEDEDGPTTDHIPAYGQTHATPGVPYSENPLNPGLAPTILPGPAPR